MYVVFVVHTFIVLFIFSSFLDLIQREWLDGGHPFSLRHAHTINAPEKERGPVFLLFLDTVWQVMDQLVYI